MKVKRLNLLLLVLCAICMPMARAATYYVATNGSDSNPGTITQPFATVNQAIYAVSSTPGSIIYIRQGTYYLGATPIYFDSIGTSAAHIIIQPYNREVVTIDGSGLSSSDATIQISGQYLEFNNIKVANSGSIGILCYQSSHVWVQGNTVYNSQDGAIAVGDWSTLTATNYAVVSDNEAYNNDLMNQPRTATGWPATVRTQGASNVTFSNNRIHDNYGEGIDLLQSNNSSALNNIVWDNYSAEIYLDNTTNAIVNANLVYNTGDTRFWSLSSSGDCSSASTCPSSSIQIANETYPGFQNIGHNRTITNNIVIGGNQNFYYGDYGSGGGLVNDIIANNTFYAPFTGSGGANLYLDGSASYSNTIIENNIFDSAGSKDVEIYATSGQLTGKVTFKTNAWYGGTNAPGLASGTGDILTNPKLVNPSNLPLGFKLQNGSPAINAGTTISGVTTDFAGVSRPQGAAYDIGAFERAP